MKFEDMEEHYRRRNQDDRSVTIRGKRCEECHGLGKRIIPCRHASRVENNHYWTECKACNGLGLVDADVNAESGTETTAQSLAGWEKTNA